MTVDAALLLHIAEALGLGFGVSLLIWLLRRYKPIRQARVSLVLAASMGGLYLIVSGSGLPGESTIVKLAAAIGILASANAGLQFLDILIWEYVIGRRQQAAVPRLLVDLFNFLVLLLVALAVLSQVLEVNLSALLVTSTIVSAVIGLALQDMLGNVVAGLALQLEQPFKVGDWVRFAEHEGHVVQMNWRTLTICTRDGNEIILPNAYVAKNEFSNYSRPTSLQRLHSQVGVAYHHPPGLVKEILFRAAAGVEEVCRDPAPEILIKSYGDFAIYYDVRFWITDFSRALQIQDAVATRVWYALRRAGMKIPLASHEVTLRALPDDHEERLRHQAQRQIFDVLRQLAVFKPLTDSHIERLAESASILRYTAGEVLVAQGEEGHSLFVLTAGEARAEVAGSRGTPVLVGTLGPGEFFGEMSLLTGEPRAASVVALTDAEVVVVDKAGFAAILATDPHVVEAMSAVLESRARRLAQQVAAHAEPTNTVPPMPQTALLKRIRAFFRIESD